MKIRLLLSCCLLVLIGCEEGTYDKSKINYSNTPPPFNSNIYFYDLSSSSKKHRLIHDQLDNYYAGDMDLATGEHEVKIGSKREDIFFSPNYSLSVAVGQSVSTYKTQTPENLTLNIAEEKTHYLKLCSSD